LGLEFVPPHCAPQAPNEDLQNFSRPNKRALHKKAKSRSRKKATTKDIRQEVIGELDDWD
jgi:hypothetical protein